MTPKECHDHTCAQNVNHEPQKEDHGSDNGHPQQHQHQQHPTRHNQNHNLGNSNVHSSTPRSHDYNEEEPLLKASSYCPPYSSSSQAHKEEDDANTPLLIIHNNNDNHHHHHHHHHHKEEEDDDEADSISTSPEEPDTDDSIPACCANGSCMPFSFLPPELLKDPTPPPVRVPPATEKTTSNKDHKTPAAVAVITVRSTIECKGICCSAEIPMIHKVMDPVLGVSKTRINVPLKQVLIDHDAAVISAQQIQDILNKAGFGATIRRDGGGNKSNNNHAAAGNHHDSSSLVLSNDKIIPQDGQTTTRKGRSHFHVQRICCASEIPAINAILLPMEGVVDVSINVTNKMVYVDHDINVVSAKNVCDALNDLAFGATIRKDFGKANNAAPGAPIFVTSELKLSNQYEIPDTTTLKRFLASFTTDQMESFAVDLPSKLISIVHNPLLLALADIVATMQKHDVVAGLDHVTILTDGADTVHWEFPTLEDSTPKEIEEGDDMPWPKTSVILSGLCWMLSLLSVFGHALAWMEYIALLSVALGIPGIAVKSFHTLRRAMFDTNCLVLFAATGAIILGEYTEAAAVTFLFALSEWLEARATTRARNALNAVVHLRPEFAFMVHPKTKEHVLVPAASVPVGAVVAVKTGDKIPCDGMVVEGQSTVNEASLTGESKPVRKGLGDAVSGGTINCGASHLMIKTTATADDSAVSRLIALVEEAQANRSQTEKLVDEFAEVYTPIVVVSALAMCTIPWLFGAEVGREWTYNGLVLMVVACPCALIISTPVTYVAGLAATAQRGILIKGGAHLEALGLVKSICFDKTGTLTQGSFALLAMDIIGSKYSRKQVLEYLCLMEERANHPLALAIIDGARNEGVVSPKGKAVTEHNFLAGRGLSGRIDGLEILVGNVGLFKDTGLLQALPEDLENKVANWEFMGRTVGYMSIEGSGIVAAYCVADAVRPESKEVVAALHKLGISVNMLTGDNHDTAGAIGRFVGLKQEGIQSELLPEDKLKFIKGLKSDGAKRSIMSNPLSNRQLVMMVGDGVNDAPALAAADVSVSMGVGAALAMETADITLLDSNLEKLLFSLEMGQKVLWKIKENVAFSLVVKVLVLALAMAGKVQLWLAILSDVGAMLCVTLNGMMLLPERFIDREMMGDVENVTYHSQVSGVSGCSNDRDDFLVNMPSIDIAYGTFNGQETKVKPIANRLQF